MKLGLVLALAAVCLFSATIIWSAQKTVEHPSYKQDYIFGKISTPARRGLSKVFYAAETVRSVSIQAPVDVELNEGFTGVELHGDTSMFKYLRVSTTYGHLNVGQGQLAGRTDGPGGLPIGFDSIAQLIKTAGITVKVGIGPGAAGGNPNRRFSFAGCNKVYAVSPIHGRNLNIQLQQTDSVSLSVDFKAIDINQYSVRPETTKGVLQLSGKVDQLYVSRILSSHLAATQLLAREVYVRQAKNSILDLFASEIANIQTQDDNCILHLEGNPAYTRIKENEIANY